MDNEEHLSYEEFMTYVEMLKVIGNKEKVEVINMLISKMDIINGMELGDLEKLDSEIRRNLRSMENQKITFSKWDFVYALLLTVIAILLTLNLVKIIFFLLQLYVTYVNAPIFKSFRVRKKRHILIKETKNNLEILDGMIKTKKARNEAIDIEELREGVSLHYFNHLIHFISARISEVPVGHAVYERFSQVINNYNEIKGDSKLMEEAVKELGELADIIVEAAETSTGRDYESNTNLTIKNL